MMTPVDQERVSSLFRTEPEGGPNYIRLPSTFDEILAKIPGILDKDIHGAGTAQLEETIRQQLEVLYAEAQHWGRQETSLGTTSEFLYYDAETFELAGDKKGALRVRELISVTLSVGNRAYIERTAETR